MVMLFLLTFQIRVQDWICLFQAFDIWLQLNYNGLTLVITVLMRCCLTRFDGRSIQYGFIVSVTHFKFK